MKKQARELAALSAEKYKVLNQERAERTKAWRQLYKVTRSQSVELNKKVLNDEMTAEEAIAELRKVLETDHSPEEPADTEDPEGE